MARFYKAKDIVKVGSGYLATGGLVAGSFLLGGPVAMAAAGAAAGALAIISVRAQKKGFADNLVRYPEAPADSPHLQEMVKGLYKAAGIKSDDYPVYKVSIAPPAKREGPLAQAMKKQLGIMQRTLNAGANRTMGKTTVIITEPLLKLLNEEEQKAALAHEFVHAGARHLLFSKPNELAKNVVQFSNAIAQAAAVVSAGWVGALAGVGALVGAKGFLAIATRKIKLLNTKDKDLTLPDIVRKKRFKTTARIVGGVAFAGALAYFSPAYLGLFAAVKGMAVASRLLNESMSRRDEYQADAGIVKLGADPLALATALRKMECVIERSYDAAEAHDGSKFPTSGALRKAWKKMTANHPATEKRIERLAKIARKQGVPEEKIQAAAKGEINVPERNNLPYSVVREMVLH